jgi:hypothetical protein
MEPIKRDENSARYKAPSKEEKKVETKVKETKSVKGQEMGSAKFKKR